MQRHKPGSEAELAELVAGCASSRKRIGIVGAGTRPVGNPVEADAIVETGALSGISLYEPGALTVVAGAGMPLQEINETLAAENQHLPFEPADYAGLFGGSGKSTIGGVVATAAAGPRAIQAGSVRDALIGVRFVSGEGEMIKNGGRVMKNVTGYDLVKLIAGSHGTLGIMTEVAFKLLPRPQTAATVIVSGVEPGAAVQLLTAALGSPYDVSGAAYDPALEGGAALIRIEGFENSVRYRAEQLSQLLAKDLASGSQIATETDDAEVNSTWRAIRDLTFASGSGILLKTVLKPSAAPEFVSAMRKSHQFDYLLDRGGGLVWINAAGTSDKDALALIETARDAAANLGGHVTIMRAAADVLAKTDAFHPQGSRLEAISASLRRKFDPAGILNPGRMAREKVGA